MSEPREDDDIALDKATSCEECERSIVRCTCNEPDLMYADIYED